MERGRQVGGRASTFDYRPGVRRSQRHPVSCVQICCFPVAQEAKTGRKLNRPETIRASMKTMWEQMSSRRGYYEGVLYDLARQGRGIPAGPLVLVGILPD